MGNINLNKNATIKRIRLTKKVGEYAKEGFTLSKISVSLGIAVSTVQHYYKLYLSECAKNKEYFSNGLITGKEEPYYKNESDYGIQELTYNFNDCKTEYQLEGKESFTYSKRGDITIQEIQRVGNTNQSNPPTVGNYKQ